MFTTRARLLVIAATTTVLATVAAPAVAETATVRDGADTTASLHDIRTVKVAHAPRNVFVATGFTDLRRRSEAGPAGLTVFLDSNPDRPGPERAVVTGLQAGTDYQLVRVRDWRLVGDPLSCDHAVQLDFRRNVAHVRVARSCLGNPAQVRVAVRMVDEYDGSHPVTDWMKGRRLSTRWLDRG